MLCSSKEVSEQTFSRLSWHFLQDGNHDLNGLRDAISKAKSVTDKPSLIKVSTLIGYGSPNRAGTHDVHGAALGKDETAATREHLQWNYPPFEIPEEAYKALSHVEQVCAQLLQTHCTDYWFCIAPCRRWAALGDAHRYLSDSICCEALRRVMFRLAHVISQGSQEEAEWSETFAQYKTKYPEDAAEFEVILSGKLPSGWEKALPTFTPEDKARLCPSGRRCRHCTGRHCCNLTSLLAPAPRGQHGSRLAS